jgi:HTH-type transcriptional regulator/antitoxin HigA
LKIAENASVKQKDLVPIFKPKSIVSAVLNGKRSLTAEHIDKLAAFFHLPHGLFFEPIEDGVN